MVQNYQPNHLKESDIGMALLLAAPAQIYYLFVTFPWLAKRYGYVFIYQIGSVILLITTLVMPFLSVFAPLSYISDNHLPDFCLGIDAMTVQ